MYSDFAVMCTWEGDNTVMALQSARILMKAAQNAMSGRALSGALAYVQDAAGVLKTKSAISSREDLSKKDILLHTMKYYAIKRIVEAHLKLARFVKSGVNQTKAWNDSGVELVEAARAHCYYIMAVHFTSLEHSVASTTLYEIGSVLCQLFVWYFVQEHMDQFLEDGFFSKTQSRLIRDTVVDLCDQVRDQAVPLVDAFGLSDFLITSPLGRYDGDIYRHYFDRVNRAPSVFGRAPYWEESINPLVNRP